MGEGVAQGERYLGNGVAVLRLRIRMRVQCVVAALGAVARVASGLVRVGCALRQRALGRGLSRAYSPRDATSATS